MYNFLHLLLLSTPVFAQFDLELDKIIDEFQSQVTTDPPNSSQEFTEHSPATEPNQESIEKIFVNPNQNFNSSSCDHECVPFYQCNNGTVNTNGESIIDIRINDGPCGTSLLTCCQVEDILTGRPSTPPPPRETAPVGCGYRNPDGIGFSITGADNNEAQFAEFPWMVTVCNADEANSRPSCGGALIHPQAVITAAHCVADKNTRWEIRAGEWDIIKTVEPVPHQEVRVRSITVHPEFYAGALYNDIAFLYLDKPVVINDNVNTICLPAQDFQHRVNRCFTTGWGKKHFGEKGQYPVILKKVDLPVVPRDVCQENLRRTRLGRYFQLHSSFMCAGGEPEKDACNGDGGGPLVCPLEKEPWRYYHAGIVSWGIGCGNKDVPGVYADVAKFRNWIDEQMALNNLDSVSYDNNVGLKPRF
ncbi:unnamed protein product [Phyllotreta striolata]|uniref:Phenoloxidase-activating factor 2 n=1 Tax=Phyllotreta striolata TaxID=444603 RepID=A0A9N9TWT1_PHYSR|nr:unnamed protein product [Phyllotreta striolata]